jgi:hypothetical protein
MKASPLLFLSFLIAMSSHAVSSDSLFNNKLETQLRFDDRSNRDHRFQYRVRAYSAFSIPDTSWTINAFAVTGDEFSSSHNTIDSDVSNYFYLRRIYFRHTGSLGSKTEIGVIPTYKGRVSSSGLAKDGWIKGARHVYAYDSATKFEVVIGELEDDNASTALDGLRKLNYVELEMSSQINDYSSYEVSLERMTDANFARAEYRYFTPDSPTYSIEMISRLSTSKTKFVLGLEDEITVFDRPFEYYAYYSYVSRRFGARAELTEDFITTGNGLSVEIETNILQSDRWEAFARLDVFDQNTRFILGVGYAL